MFMLLERIPVIAYILLGICSRWTLHKDRMISERVEVGANRRIDVRIPGKDHMLPYHGTNHPGGRPILARGQLRPRGSEASRWVGHLTTHPDMSSQGTSLFRASRDPATDRRHRERKHHGEYGLAGFRSACPPVETRRLCSTNRVGSDCCGTATCSCCLKANSRAYRVIMVDPARIEGVLRKR
jgi:hypothetical protein